MPRFGRWDEDPYDDPGAVMFDAPQVGTVAPPPPPDPYGGGAPEDFGSFDLPSYGGSYSPSFNFEAAPGFDAPDFYAPSFEDAQNEPGYAFRLKSGADALERSAAARGTLRTGGTQKGLIDYGQATGAQEYSNVYDRALRTYAQRMNAAQSEYAPRLAEWQARFGAEQARGLAGFEREWMAHQAELENQRFMEGLRFQLLNQGQPNMTTMGGGY